MAGLNVERLILGAMMLGIGQRAFDDALAYVKERKQFDRPIGSFQTIKHRLADLATELECCRLLVYDVARKVDADPNRMLPREASMAKLKVTETAKKIALEGMQMMGGYGYASEYDMERHVRATLVSTIYGGTTEIQREIISQDLRPLARHAMIRGQFRLLVRLWRLNPPGEILWKVGRWSTALFVREFAFQLTLPGGARDRRRGGSRRHRDNRSASSSSSCSRPTSRSSRAWRGRATAAPRIVERELQEIPGEPAASRFPRSHLVLPFLMLIRADVRKRRGVVFHDEDGLRLRLDVYRPREAPLDPKPRPAVVQVHGGGWIAGSRLEQGIPLLNHMAANGWIGFNVDYRLSPRATLPDHVIDVKRAIAWVRENADELRVDPQRICLTGGSAGGHLCALAALTADDRSLQPGFEDADTSVAAAVPFYGVYDMLDDDAVYYEGLRSWLLEEIVIKRTPGRGPRGLPRGLTHPPRPRRRAAVPGLPRRARHARPARGRARLRPQRLEATSESEVALRRAPRRRARLRPVPLAAHRAGGRGHRAVPAHRGRAAARRTPRPRRHADAKAYPPRHEPGDPPGGPRRTAAARPRPPSPSTA